MLSIFVEYGKASLGQQSKIFQMLSNLQFKLLEEHQYQILIFVDFVTKM